MAIVNVHFHWTCSGVTSPADSLQLLLFVDLWGWPVWLVGFNFPLLFWLVFLQQLGMLCIYSCGGGLLLFFLVSLWGKFTVAIDFFFFFLFCNWLLETLLCLKFISATPALGDFLWAAVINRNPRACELEVLVSLFGQVVVIGNVYRRLHFLKQSGSWESQHPGLWIRANCTWANT